MLYLIEFWSPSSCLLFVLYSFTYLYVKLYVPVIRTIKNKRNDAVHFLLSSVPNPSTHPIHSEVVDVGVMLSTESRWRMTLAFLYTLSIGLGGVPPDQAIQEKKGLEGSATQTCSFFMWTCREKHAPILSIFK